MPSVLTQDLMQETVLLTTPHLLKLTHSITWSLCGVFAVILILTFIHYDSVCMPEHACDRWAQAMVQMWNSEDSVALVFPFYLHMGSGNPSD